jgi:uncharacterized protein
MASSNLAGPSSDPGGPAAAGRSGPVIRLTLPMPEPERSRVMAIRTGERSFEEAIAEIDEVERRLARALEATALPPAPDHGAVDAFLVEAYRRSWGW